MPPLRATRTMCPPEGLAKLPVVGDTVEVFWDGDDTYYRGTLTRREKNHRFKFFVRYDDGDKENINLDAEYWRYADTDRDGHGKVFFKPGELTELYGETASVPCAVLSTAELAPVSSRASTATIAWNEPVEKLPIKVRFKRGLRRVTPSHLETGSTGIAAMQAGMDLSPASGQSGIVKNDVKESTVKEPTAVRVTERPVRRMTLSTMQGVSAWEWNSPRQRLKDVSRAAGSLSDGNIANSTTPHRDVVHVLRSGRALTGFAFCDVEHNKVTSSPCSVGRIEAKASTATFQK